MKKRLFAVAAAALIPTLGLLTYNEIANRNQRTEEIHSQAAQAARLASSEIERILEGTRSLLIAVSAIPAIRDLKQDSCAETLNGVASRIVQTGAILLIDANGKLVCDSQSHPPGADFSDRPYVRAALGSADVVVGDYTVSRLTGAAVLPIAIPIRRDDKVVGVLGTGIRLQWLQDRVVERGVQIGDAVTIADRNGTILARTPFAERFVGTRIPEKYLSFLTAGRPGTVQVLSQDGTERILGYEPITASNPLYVSAGVSTKTAFAKVNQATLLGVIALVLSTVIAIAASHWVGDRFILRPIDRIVKTLNRRKAGDTAARTGMSGTFELDVVGRSLDGLFEQLDEQRLELEKTDQKRALLARELSHRVKNTLTVVSALARQTFKSEPEAVGTFSERVKALSGAYDLLLSEESQNTEIGALVNMALQPYGDFGLTRCHASGPSVTLTPEMALGLSLVIHELMTNAIKYGALSNESGHVDLVWAITKESIMVSWHERGGPPVVEPAKEGFGSKLIRNALPSGDAKVKVDYLPQGLRFTVVFKSVREP